MKKTFVAVAVLGAFAGSAMAADVTLYGKIDLGLQYQHLDNGTTTTDQFKETSGQNSGSRFGLKGTEDLGNGMKVGFVLENGFSADDGKMGQGSRLFGREAQMYLTSDYGTLGFGRMGGLSSGLGSYNMNSFMAMSTGWGDQASKLSNFGLNRDRYDNSIVYRTPSFAGFQVAAQYSFKMNGQEEVHTRANQRYAALGATYKNGPFAAGLIVDSIFNTNTATETNTEDTLGVTLGAAYDFEVVKVFALGQYGKNENKFGGLSNRGFAHTDVDGDALDPAKYTTDEGVTGYMFQLGMTAPVLGGTAYATVNYSDAESDLDKAVTGVVNGVEKSIGSKDFTGYGVALGYTYNLSKRTYVYTYAGYNELKTETEGAADKKDKNTEFGFGLVHSF